MEKIIDLLKISITKIPTRDAMIKASKRLKEKKEKDVINWKQEIHQEMFYRKKQQQQQQGDTGVAVDASPAIPTAMVVDPVIPTAMTAEPTIPRSADAAFPMAAIPMVEDVAIPTVAFPMAVAHAAANAAIPRAADVAIPPPAAIPMVEDTAAAVPTPVDAAANVDTDKADAAAVAHARDIATTNAMDTDADAVQTCSPTKRSCRTRRVPVLYSPPINPQKRAKKGKGHSSPPSSSDGKVVQTKKQGTITTYFELATANTVRPTAANTTRTPTTPLHSNPVVARIQRDKRLKHYRNLIPHWDFNQHYWKLADMDDLVVYNKENGGWNQKVLKLMWNFQEHVNKHEKDRIGKSQYHARVKKKQNCKKKDSTEKYAWDQSTLFEKRGLETKPEKYPTRTAWPDVHANKREIIMELRKGVFAFPKREVDLGAIIYKCSRCTIPQNEDEKKKKIPEVMPKYNTKYKELIPSYHASMLEMNGDIVPTECIKALTINIAYYDHYKPEKDTDTIIVLAESPIYTPEDEIIPAHSFKKELLPGYDGPVAFTRQLNCLTYGEHEAMVGPLEDIMQAVKNTAGTTQFWKLMATIAGVNPGKVLKTGNPNIKNGVLWRVPTLPT